jgi:hypothetical protein
MYSHIAQINLSNNRINVADQNNAVKLHVTRSNKTHFMLITRYTNQRNILCANYTLHQTMERIVCWLHVTLTNETNFVPITRYTTHRKILCTNYTLHQTTKHTLY